MGLLFGSAEAHTYLKSGQVALPPRPGHPYYSTYTERNQPQGKVVWIVINCS